MVADHPFHLLIPLRYNGEDDLLIDDSFSDDHLLTLVTSSAPWYVDLMTYFACGITPSSMKSIQKKRSFYQAKSYFWEEPCLYKA